ncbi:AsmA family [Edwardsiella tarda]|nr:AsmA family [Edwardsiella tarda]
MKVVGKLLLTLIALLLLMLVAAYFVLQSQWGARQISTWVNDHTRYRITLGGIHHDIRRPRALQLTDFSLARAGQPSELHAAAVTLTFGGQQFSTPRHFSAIRLSQGTLRLTATGLPDLPISANTLQLQDMRLDWPQSDWPLQATGVDGGIVPLQSGSPHVAFQFSAATLHIGEIPAQNVLIQGEYRDRQLWLTNLGADLANGQMTAQAQRLADGAWNIESIRLSQIHWQSPQTLRPFLQTLKRLPPLTLQRLELLGANLEGNGWALSGLDASLSHVSLTRGDWHSRQGTLAFNARDIVLGGIHLSEPLFDADLTPQGISVRQFSTRWDNALLRTSGSWRRDTGALALNDLAIVGLEYSLPTNWRELWLRPLPNWLATITLDHFSLSRTLLVDVNPAFPFQMTALDGFGNQVTLARQHRWGIWHGQMQFNASEATFNKVDLRRPSFTLQADEQGIRIDDLSAISQKGLLEANVSLNRRDDRLSLTLDGRGVPANQLNAWGWPSLPLQGDVNLQLSLHAPLRATTPFRPGVNATLNAQDANGHHLQQRMVDGVLMTSE